MHHVSEDHQIRAVPGSQASGSVATDTRTCGSTYLFGLLIPDPQFPRKRPADPRPRPPAVTQPSPALERPSVDQLRWARCPDHGRLHLVQPADVTLAAARGHTRTVCGHRIVAEGLTISGVPLGALCMSCVIAVTS